MRGFAVLIKPIRSIHYVQRCGSAAIDTGEPTR